MNKTIDTLLLLALPASGKSEVRRYLAHLDPARCVSEFHLGPTVQLDDFPYVHIMRRIDQELVKLGEGARFFQSLEDPFQDSRDWGTLIELVNEDYDDLCVRRAFPLDGATELLMRRIDSARKRVGQKPALSRLSAGVRAQLVAALDAEARALLEEKLAGYTETLDGHTVVIEFARGGADGSDMPLPSPFGYQYSLAQLSDAILERAAILYIWVTPEESRRKNDARANPDDPGSILHHGVPLSVMLNDYGCDDIQHLIDTAGQPDRVRVETRGKVFDLPIARFDNRVDKTTFVREAPGKWRAEDVRALEAELKSTLASLANARR